MSHTNAFIQALFASCERGFLTLSAIHPAGGRPSPSRHIRCGDIQALTSAMADLQVANQRGWGAFVGIGLRGRDLGRWRRGGRADIVCLPALFADVDSDVSMAMQRVESMVPRPSALIHSGGGLHIYWFIRPTRRLRHAEAILRGLARVLGGDILTVAQSMRLPGTRNTKPYRARAPCLVLELYPQRRYQLGDFRAYHAPRRPRRPRRPQIQSPRRSDAISTVCDVLQADYGGYFKANGWLASRCPLDHQRDWPGAHFGFHPRSGVGHCFGRHGTLSLSQLQSILHLI